MAKFDKKKIKLDEYRFGGNQDEIESNKELSEYLREMYDQIKLENKMVGKFSVYGTYSIEPKMVDYLVHEAKHIRSKDGETIYAITVLENLILNFTIKFTIVGKNQKAVLYISEREFRYEENNIIHKTRLAEIVKIDHPDFVNYVYKKWNVWTDDVFVNVDNPLLRDLLDRIAMFNMLGPTLAISSAVFVKSMLGVLSNSTQGLSIVNQYNGMLNSILGKDPMFNQNGLGLKNLLDQVMRKQNFFPLLVGMKEAVPLMRNFVQPIKQLDMGKMKVANMEKITAKDIKPTTPSIDRPKIKEKDFTLKK